MEFYKNKNGNFFTDEQILNALEVVVGKPEDEEQLAQWAKWIGCEKLEPSDALVEEIVKSKNPIIATQVYAVVHDCRPTEAYDIILTMMEENYG